MPEVFERALVTGGCGFLGNDLCEQLLRRRTSVVCLDNLVTGEQAHVARMQHEPGFQLLRRDVTEPFSLPSTFDVVLHLATSASPRDYLRLPIETLRAGSLGTAHALDFTRAHDARFLLASTTADSPR